MVHNKSTTLQEFIAQRTLEESLKRKPFPLKYLLILYYKAHAKDVYIEHGKGLKLLIEWLGPIEIPQEKQSPRVPIGLGVRDSHLWRNFLGITQTILYQTLMEIENEYPRIKYF